MLHVACDARYLRSWAEVKCSRLLVQPQAASTHDDRTTYLRSKPKPKPASTTADLPTFSRIALCMRAAFPPRQ